MLLCSCGELSRPCLHFIGLAIAFGFFWAISLQLFLNLFIFRPVASAAVARKPEGSRKLTDYPRIVGQLSELFTYTTMLGVGLANVPSSPCFEDASSSSCWPEYQSPIQVLPGLAVVYLVQLSGYVQMMVTEQLLARILGSGEPPKFDTLLHHAVTLILLSGSVGFGPYTPMGSVVCLTHDSSSVFLKLARALQLSGAKKAAVPAFLTFASAFLFARLIAFPLITVLPSYKYITADEPFGWANQKRTASVLFCLLFVLYALNVFWFVKIVQTIVNRPPPDSRAKSA